jgi:RNA polymerase sigma-70 factor (ECF subfamily)
MVVAASLAARDEVARELWSAQYAPLAGWCAALVGSKELAHDIAAESFTRLLARWGGVRDPKAFLYVVALNLVRDQWRRDARERTAMQQLHAAPGADQIVDDDPWLRHLVEELPERLRAPVLLHYYADLPVKDVARALRRPQGTVKRALFDARARLLDLMEDDYDQQS